MSESNNSTKIVNVRNIVYSKRMSGKGKPYDMISVDVGYRTIALTFDRSICAELLGVSMVDLYNLPVDTEEVIGQLYVEPGTF